MSLEGTITYRGLELYINDIIKTYKIEGLKKLLRKFIIRYKSPIGTYYIEKKNYTIIDKQILILPRFAAKKLLDTNIITDVKNTIYHGNDINCNYNGISNYNQKIVINYIFNNIYNEYHLSKGLAGTTLKMTAGCHAKNTQIMLNNGLFKNVQNIQLGDELMGDDSTPRKVLSLIRGYGKMYKITNSYNETYIVNEDHILCLKYNKSKKIYDDTKQFFIISWFDHSEIKIFTERFYYTMNNKNRIKEDAMNFFHSIEEYLYIEIKVKDYLYIPYDIKQDLCDYRHIIQLPKRKLEVDPYIFGFNINKNYLVNNAYYIPSEYLYNDIKNRLLLLAGIIDSSGERKENSYIVKILSNIISLEVIFLVKSLGFIIKKGKNYTYEIFGNNLEKLPLKNKINKFNNRIIYEKDITLSNIIIEYIFEDYYYGFNVDGNNKYIMEHFIITHNCGKTYLAMDMISKIQKKTLIIVPNTYLLNQWDELLNKYFNNVKIGQYYGKKKQDGDIVIGIINSLINDEFIFKHKDKYNKKIETKISYKEYFKNFGFIILDESHIYCTNSFKTVYNRFQSTYMLGLSATPDERIDKTDIISHLNIGNVLNAEEITNYKKNDINFNATVNIIKYNGPKEFTQNHINESTKLISVPLMIEDLVNDHYRNKLILDILVELFPKKLNIFVFSDRRKHLEYLYEEFNAMLEEKYKNNLSIPELNINNNIVLYGNSSSEDIDIAKNHSNIIFTTYSYSSTGVSINRMTTMILSTPRRSKSVQIIGRIFRLHKDFNNKERIIYDIVDNMSVLKNQLYSRMKAYNERNCIIKKSEINYKDIQF